MFKDKICAIMLPGKSIEELEHRIQEYKDYDIVWTSLGMFNMMEDFILSKIDKKLSLVLNCSSVADSFIKDFEFNIRKPRLEEFLSRPEDNIWLTTNGIIDLYCRFLRERDFIDKYLNKIHIVDNIFPKNQIGKYMSVPSSVTLLIAFLMAKGAKRIVLFGYDGYLGDPIVGLDAYYQPELVREERYITLGSIIDHGINRGTYEFNRKFHILYFMYKELFGSKTEILNCSPDSLYTNIKKTNYEEVKKWLI